MLVCDWKSLKPARRWLLFIYISDMSPQTSTVPRNGLMFCIIKTAQGLKECQEIRTAAGQRSDHSWFLLISKEEIVLLVLMGCLLCYYTAVGFTYGKQRFHFWSFWSTITATWHYWCFIDDFATCYHTFLDPANAKNIDYTYTQSNQQKTSWAYSTLLFLSHMWYKNKSNLWRERNANLLQLTANKL